jgi:hypothetical protein
MPASIAHLKSEGLSQEDIRIATALLYCRYRCLFSSIGREHDRDGGTVLVVKGVKVPTEPMLKIFRWHGKYVCVECQTDEVFESDCIADLLDTVRGNYPSISSL